MSRASIKNTELTGVSTVLIATVAATIAALGCGSSGTARPGSGGTTGATGGSGNAVGAGGSGNTVGGGGSVGTGGSASGGSTGTTQASCTPGLDPTTALLTDFTAGTSWNALMGKWGVAGAGSLQGSLFSFQGPNSGGMWKATVEPSGDLAIGVAAGAAIGPGTVAAGDYAGGGLSFGATCVDTSTWTGVSFTLGGTSGGCDILFQVQTFDEQVPANHGGCVSTSCYVWPYTKVQIGSAPITVHFSDLTSSLPVGDPAIAKQIVGLEWQLESPAPPAADAAQPACPGAELLIDNVQFVSN
jgi:hypothetical protein